ncbi:hypothetical protein H4R21_005217 [Coemansia helicoidea]|uniref:Uncharacterized protein n=1 Tax=Coemansia helicoidea TaxID=1286919 RepID=A0ACC1KV38_9FUNG|nr:hypothetical protein H4R21_005217 [Coemansia helicoidea]
MSEPKIRTEALEAIFKSVWKKPGTAIKGDALELSAELLLLFAKEAIERAKAKHAESGRAEEEPVDESDLEKILAQLLLDF